MSDYQSNGASTDLSHEKSVVFSLINQKSSLWPSPAHGKVILNNIEYTVHALECMAPKGLIRKGNEMVSRGIPHGIELEVVKRETNRPGFEVHKHR